MQSNPLTAKFAIPSIRDSQRPQSKIKYNSTLILIIFHYRNLGSYELSLFKG